MEIWFLKPNTDPFEGVQKKGATKERELLFNFMIQLDIPNSILTSVRCYN